MGSVLLCWVLFAGAGLALYKTIEGPRFTRAAGDHRLLGGGDAAIAILAVLATASVILGAAPLVLAALRQGRERPAARRPPCGARRAASTAVGYILAFLVASAALDAIVHPQVGISGGLSAAILAGWAAAALGCGLGCVQAARRGLAAIGPVPCGPKSAFDQVPGGDDQEAEQGEEADHADPGGDDDRAEADQHPEHDVEEQRAASRGGRGDVARRPHQGCPGFR